MTEIENKCTECGGELEFVNSSEVDLGVDFATNSNLGSMTLNLYKCKSCNTKCYIV